MKLQTRIFAGLLTGVAVGGISKMSGFDALRAGLVLLEPLGTVFIRLVTMVVVPMVVASLFLGVASLGDVRRLGRIGGKTLAWFFLSTVVAACIGLAAAQIAGVGNGLNQQTRESLVGQTPDVASHAPVIATPPSLVQTLVEMTPQNPFAAAAQGDLLPLIISVCIFAAAATVSRGEGTRAVLAFFEGVNDLSMVVIRWLMALAPAAVFVLIAATVAKSGVDLLVQPARVRARRRRCWHGDSRARWCSFHSLRFTARAFLSQCSSASDRPMRIMLAFSTASSSVTLPVSMAAARERVGISNGIVSFVLPAGVTLNKNGAAVYKAVTAVFIARLYGLELGVAQQLTIVLTSTLAAFAGAGVPGSSLVTTLIVLNAMGLGPHAAAGIALVVGVDRPLDMCRAAVNVTGNLIGAAWVARTEGESISPA